MEVIAFIIAIGRDTIKYVLIFFTSIIDFMVGVLYKYCSKYILDAKLLVTTKNIIF